MPNNEWGDFQTPQELADQVVETLAPRPWSRVLEPTCGVGNFLIATERLNASQRIGIEVQDSYVAKARSSGATILHRNIFDLNLSQDLPWANSGPLLVIGNPPWVTNAELGSLGSINLPQKINLRNLHGLDALTGSSNFDIAEYIWLKIAIELANHSPTIALLCKTQVARNVLEYAHSTGLPLTDVSIRRIDAKKWFDASVHACLFTATIAGQPDWVVPEYPNLVTKQEDRRLGFALGRLVADIDAHRRSGFADGTSPLEWRQGVKHDAAGVMELAGSSPSLATRAGAAVALEDEWVFPLLKCTDLHRGRLKPNKSVIVTQRALADDVSQLEATAPKLWAYLDANAKTLDGRKSSIYKGRPRFSMFGVGDYTFAPWKVAVSGLHSDPQFQLVGPVDGRPVVFDDTCYLLPFNDGPSAAIATALLRSNVTADLLRSLTFPDSKRPVTKKLLQRIDLSAVAASLDSDTLAKAASETFGQPLSSLDVEEFIDAHLAQQLLVSTR